MDQLVADYAPAHTNVPPAPAPSNDPKLGPQDEGMGPSQEDCDKDGPIA